MPAVKQGLNTALNNKKRQTCYVHVFFKKPLKTGGGHMKQGEKLIVIGCGGAGGPAAMLSKKLMPDVDVTIIRKEPSFIVR